MPGAMGSATACVRLRARDRGAEGARSIHRLKQPYAPLTSRQLPYAHQPEPPPDHAYGAGAAAFVRQAAKVTWHHVGLAAVRLADRSTTVTAEEAVLPDWRRTDTVVRTDKSESPFLL